MANQIRIKRRASTGSAGAPASLLNAELAYNEADNILYYGYGDNGSGVATSVVAIAGSGNSVTVGTTQTITGDKTFSGLLDATGTFKIDGVEVTASAAEINYLVGVTAGVQGQIDGNETHIDNLATLSGVAKDEVDLGAFTGSTISDDQTVKSALQELETALEAADSDAVDLRTMSGTSDGDTDLGTFAGSVISDSTTTKAALGELEAAIEANEVHIDNAATLSGVAKDEQDLGTFTGGVIADSSTIKGALQALENQLEDGSGTLTADDSNTAAFSSGTVTISGDTGISTTASGNELKIDLDDTAVTAAAYGAADSVPTYTVDQQGRLTAAADVSIDILHTQVSDFDAGVQANTLDSLAQPVAAVAMNSQKITGLANPQDDQDAATKIYVDQAIEGLDPKESVRAATTASVALSNTQTVDGVALVAGDRVLVKNQSTASENGVYLVVSGGSWTRSEDFNSDADISAGAFFFVEEGTANGNAGFTLTTDEAIVLDTTDLAFVQFSGAGQITAGNGLSKSGNTLNVGTADVGRVVVNANDIDLATHGTAGTYNGLTVDAYGRVSSFATPTTLAGYSIVDAQALDAGLTSIAGLTTAADQMIYATGADTYATTSLSTYARSLLDDADAAAARTTLALGTIATQDASSVAITGGTIDNVVFDGGTF